MRTEKKLALAKSRHQRVRKKVSGTDQRPRMAVKFSGLHIYVQFIDDTKGVTLAATSTRAKATAGQKIAANVVGAKKLGAIAAEVAKDKGIKTVVFDRGAKPFHGKVKALADAAREAGLQF